MGIFSQDEEPSWSDVIHLEEQVKELKAENKRLKESNEELTSDNLNTIQEMDNERRRVEQLKQDIEAYKQSEQEAQEIIAELKAYKDINEDFKTAWEELKAENEKLASWLESSEREKKELCNVIHKRKEQIQTLKYMLFDEKEIPKDKFTMYYRIAQNERRTKSHRDLCTNIVKNYKQTLQEIKAIAETGMHCEGMGCDFMPKILELITKAEEE